MEIHEIRFTVWQFVRLMVHLEDRPKPTAAEAALLTAWGDIWAPVDQELARLAQSDADGYAEMMMGQDVVIDAPATDLTATAKAALETVMAEMDRVIDVGGEDDLISSLKFERRELRQLTRKLGRQI